MDFLNHVKEGLSKKPKKISSRYFYDAKGDALFKQIMGLEEYYLPKCEMNIIKNKSKQIAQDLRKVHQDLQIVELGAGNGTKTKHLISHFEKEFRELEYVAMDISTNVLSINKTEIISQTPRLTYKSLSGNYFETYKDLEDTAMGRLVLFLGANIGNYPTPQAVVFFNFVKSKLKANDHVLVAFDLVKHPRKIIAAYDDKKGITKQFNLNLLARMNRELGANFDLTQFEHFPFYNPLTGITSSQIISLQKTTVTFSDGFSAHFDAFEAINTEVSKKFFFSDIEEIAEQAQMNIAEYFYDSKKEYVFVLFHPNTEVQ
jgi:dimethylhistidine N-methyltransferase